jgi:hypothetical protein
MISHDIDVIYFEYLGRIASHLSRNSLKILLNNQNDKIYFALIYQSFIYTCHIQICEIQV